MFSKEKITTCESLLVTNTIWSFLSQGLPLIIAVFTIPLIIKGFGTARFSILTLVWAIIGYSSLFDFGLGRALTQLVSKKIGQADTKDMPIVIWTALIVINILGVLGSILVVFLSPFIVTHILKVPPLYYNETLYSMWYLAFSLPLLINIVCLKGILEAYQEFKKLSFLRIPVVLFNYIGPLLVLPFTHNLSVTVALLVVGRFITFILHILACKSVIKDLFKNISFDKNYIKPLISFGGWITVSNIINPLMLYMDRFFIANMISALVVAYYVTPHEVINKFWLISASINVVIFPALTTEFYRDVKKAKHIYYQAIKYTAILVALPVIIIFLFAKVGLTLWIGADFAEKSYQIAQVLACGTLIFSINQISYSLVQSTGRSDITAKLHMIEVPVYLVALWIFIKHFGIIGAAYAWVLRIFIDSLLLFIIAHLLLKDKINEKKV
jgi:O-antigen/teichoic acid export membrane protein